MGDARGVADAKASNARASEARNEVAWPMRDGVRSEGGLWRRSSECGKGGRREEQRVDGVDLTGGGGGPGRPDPSADAEPPSDADDDEEDEDEEDEDDADDGSADPSALAPRALVVCSRRWPCPTRLLRNVLREVGETTSTSLLVLSRGEETGGGLLIVFASCFDVSIINLTRKWFS